ncbi:MAG: histidine kinase N-terminal 7TM domain-containing protein [Carboxydocellales bacterium]
MKYQYMPYVWLLLIAGIVTLTNGLFAWRFKAARGAKPFTVFMLILTFWAWGNALEMTATDLPTKLFWANVQYFSYAFFPIALLVLVLNFDEKEHWLTGRRLIMLLIIPAITNILIWTNGFHGLLRQNVFLDLSGSFPVIHKDYGMWFWVHTAYTYTINITSVFLLGKGMFRKSSLYRIQIKALFIGALVTLISNLLYVLKLSPITRFDITPALFGITGTILGWSILRHKMFDIIPIARATVVEELKSGVVVLDGRNRVVDVNRLAQKILGWDINHALGRQAEEILNDYPNILDLCKVEELSQGKEIMMKMDGVSKDYQVNATLLHNRGTLVGRVILFHNITEIKQAQKLLIQQQRALAVVEERERQAKELHDNLGQVLGYINVQSQAIREQVLHNQDELVVKSLEQLSRVAQSAHLDIREYIHSLRNITYVEENFLIKLKEYAGSFESNYNVPVKIELSANLANSMFTPLARVQLFRIIQEALNNTRKHAEASLVRLLLTHEAEQIMVSIEDNGKGFEVGEGKPCAKKLGLSIMQDRALEMGGSIQIVSNLGLGTKIMVKVPISGGREGGREFSSESAPC